MPRLFPCSLLLALVFGLSACATTPMTAGTAADSGTVDVVTLNIWHDKPVWPQRRQLIVRTLHELQPDVIALQEVIQHAEQENQAKELAAALGYRYAFASVDPVDAPKRYGNALLTRHPILAEDSRKLQPLGEYRVALHVRVAIGGRPVNVYVTHLSHRGEDGPVRQQQVDDLLDFVATTRGDAPTLIAGDFNTRVDAPEMRKLDADYRSAFDAIHPDADPARTSTLNLQYFKPKRIDHIYAQRDAFAIEASRILLDQPDTDGSWASDHYGVHARLRLLPDRAPTP